VLNGGLAPGAPSATGQQKDPQIRVTQTTSRRRCSAGPALGHRTRRARRPGPGHAAALTCGRIGHMTELTDVSGAFGYGDSILVGERVRLRGVRDDDLPTLAKWQLDPGRMATLSSWVAPPSEAAANGVCRGGPLSRVGAARRALVRRGADVHPRPRVGGPPIVGPMSEPLPRAPRGPGGRRDNGHASPRRPLESRRSNARDSCPEQGSPVDASLIIPSAIDRPPGVQAQDISGLTTWTPYVTA